MLCHRTGGQPVLPLPISPGSAHTNQSGYTRGIHYLLFLVEEGFGVCSFPLLWKAARSAQASWARPPRLAEWVPLSPGTVKAIPLTGSRVAEPVEFSHHIRGASKSLTGAGR